MSTYRFKRYCFDAAKHYEEDTEDIRKIECGREM
jgi:hypothetical protein